MATRQTLLSMALFLMIGMNVFASRGFYVTIHNQTANTVTIKPGGYDWWAPRDFDWTQTMGPWETRTFYTLDLDYHPGIVRINIDYGYGLIRAEMWVGGHAHSVTKNISSCKTHYLNAYIGTASDFITTSLYSRDVTTPGGTWCILCGTLNLQPQTGNSVGGFLRPVAHDVCGDGRTDVALVSDDTWHLFLSSQEFAHSSSHDLDKSGTPLLADLDGDGLADPVMVDQTGAWHVWYSSQGYQMSGPHDLGLPGTPLAADFDGDGKDDPGFYYHSSGAWSVFLSASGYQQVSFTLGGSSARPVPKDYDGDGKADPAVYDSSSGTWLISGSASGYALATASLGGLGCAPAPEDFDGDGLVDPAVYAPSTAEWQILLSGSLATQGGYTWWGGVVGDINGIPVPADYDGDGLADFAVYHQDTGFWELYPSTQGYQLVWGGFGGAQYQPVKE